MVSGCKEPIKGAFGRTPGAHKTVDLEGMVLLKGFDTVE
jgi:hypothetical protein